MPMLNLSPVLTSPMLLDTFTVNRRQQSINNYGEASTTVTANTNIRGIVFPSDENDLKRLPDAQIQAKAITVITAFALRGESETGTGGDETQFQPDIVVWNGDSFMVRVVEDYTNYAAGFVLAVCTSIDLVDEPPGAISPNYGFGNSPYGGVYGE